MRTLDAIDKELELVRQALEAPEDEAVVAERAELTAAYIALAQKGNDHEEAEEAQKLKAQRDVLHSGRQELKQRRAELRQERTFTATVLQSMAIKPRSLEEIDEERAELAGEIEDLRVRQRELSAERNVAFELAKLKELSPAALGQLLAVQGIQSAEKVNSPGAGK